MSNTLLGFGLFAVVAAIVGGGLEAFGFRVGVLKSTPRQIGLFVLGLILIASAEWNWNRIRPLVFPPRLTIETNGPRTLEPGQTVKIPLSLTEAGQVDVAIQNLAPDWNGFSGQKGLPGQDALYVSICTAKNGDPCKTGEMEVSDVLSQELPSGTGVISVFNFATSPRMTFTLRVKHPAGKLNPEGGL